MFKPKITETNESVSYYTVVEVNSGVELALLAPETSFCMRICLPKIEAEAVCTILNSQPGMGGSGKVLS